MNILPRGWVVVTPLDVAEPIRGVTYKKEQASSEPRKGYSAILRANNIQGDRILMSDLVFVPDENISLQQRLKRNDIVIAMSSGSLSVVGKSAQVKNDIEASFGAFCGALRPSQEIDARYLGHFLKSEAYRSAISAMARGVNINNLKWSHFENIDLPLAPAAEQKRIADKLDALLARVDAARARLDRIPTLLKCFRQSVLAATSGQLTEDWRNDSDAEDWIEGVLGDFTHVIDPNPSHRYPSYENGIVPLVSTEQMSGLTEWDLSKAKLASESFWEDRKAIHGFEATDIIFARKGRLGLARFAPRRERYVFSHTVFIVRVKTGVWPSYLLYFLMQDQVVNWLKLEMNSNTGVPTLGKAVMERVPISMPGIDEQKEIALRVESLLALADKLEARYITARGMMDKLAPALLAKAFRGELVPQGPNDEPADQLLARIRASAPEKERPQKSRKKTESV